MPTFEKCPESVHGMVRDILCQYSDYKPFLDARLKIDLLFAFPDYDEKTGEPKNDALKLHGVKCAGIARKIKLKDRVMGRGDVEICIDGDWWNKANEAEQKALLDHELYHFIIVTDSNGKAETDDFTRPKVVMRPHDFDMGWFEIIARRHGMASAECQQAKKLMDTSGQFFWPEFDIKSKD